MGRFSCAFGSYTFVFSLHTKKLKAKTEKLYKPKNLKHFYKNLGFAAVVPTRLNLEIESTEQHHQVLHLQLVCPVKVRLPTSQTRTLLKDDIANTPGVSR